MDNSWSSDKSVVSSRKTKLTTSLRTVKTLHDYRLMSQHGKFPSSIYEDKSRVSVLTRSYAYARHVRRMTTICLGQKHYFQANGLGPVGGPFSGVSRTVNREFKPNIAAMNVWRHGCPLNVPRNAYRRKYTTNARTVYIVVSKDDDQNEGTCAAKRSGYHITNFFIHGGYLKRTVFSAPLHSTTKSSSWPGIMHEPSRMKGHV